jgi:hypothetical protein
MQRPEYLITPCEFPSLSKNLAVEGHGAWSVHMKMDEKGGAREKQVMGNVSTG